MCTLNATEATDWAAKLMGVTVQELDVLAGLIRGMEAIEECGIALSDRVIAIGGGSRSPAYTTLLADLPGRPVEVIREPEATARGACLQAKALVDGLSIRDAASRFRPEPERIVEPHSGEGLLEFPKGSSNSSVSLPEVQGA